MRAAIYARYSSENQSEKSIDDQVRVCKKYLAEHDISIEERHIFVDKAISGSVVNRPGLQDLEKAIENKEVDAVAVDDLSRLSRGNHQMLTMVMKFNYHQVKIISVSEGIVTDDDNAKLGIHIRGFINELYLDDLKKKTMRGLEGQKIRGFSAGESVYGYCTQPVGEMKLDKRGKPRYEGKIHKIHPEEAEIVRRIYKEFVDGKSINKIVSSLNADKIPTKRGLRGGWSTPTISRILKNEKYVGEWIWRKKKNVRDPMSGKIKKIPRAENEQMPVFREDLMILDKDIWDRSQRRWLDIKETWPIKKCVKERKEQKSYVYATPSHLFSGLMKCHECGGAIVLLSGKGSGYYGCHNSRRKTCSNMLLVPCKRVEECILSELQTNILTPENIEYVYKNVEKLAGKALNDNPETIKLRKAQCDKLSVEIQNYLNYIKAGNFSSAVSDALKEAELREKKFKEEIGSMEYQKANAFKTPPREWITHRLETLRDTLNKNTSLSAEALKELLGEIRLEAVTEKELSPKDIIEGSEIASGPSAFAKASADRSAPRNDDGKALFKPYYVAHTKIRTLALLDEEHKGSNWYHWRTAMLSNPRDSKKNPEDSNWYQWRTRYVPIRTVSEITANMVIPVDKLVILYKILALKAKRLHMLGMSYEAIGRSLRIGHETARRACHYEN